MTHEVGSLVTVRGREWVVLPESKQHPDTLILQPISGDQREKIGVYLPLERVEQAQFPLPSPDREYGNYRSCRLLRDAARFSLSWGVGPFRSLSRMNVVPRPYQFVPLLMALRQDTVRLLIADDVGVGKTIESCMIIKELLDRMEIRSFAILCPPHLAEQWRKELVESFDLPAVTVLSGTTSRLERSCRQGETLFEKYPFTVVSVDYVKGDRMSHEFVRACPDLVVVDEAHSCVGGNTRTASHQRHELLKRVADSQHGCNQDGKPRHLILVTATPHSGNEESFQSLVSLLDKKFENLPTNLEGEVYSAWRKELAQVMVQRRRADLENFLEMDTPFPEREIAENSYALSAPYQRFLNLALDYCRKSLSDTQVRESVQRVRWWSALNLLQSIASSPAATVATLTRRAQITDEEVVDVTVNRWKRAVFDLEDDAMETSDVMGEMDDGEASDDVKQLLVTLELESQKLTHQHDQKLIKAVGMFESLLDEGYCPIVFCRFIPTVHYVANQLDSRWKRRGYGDVSVVAITGELTPEEREQRIAAIDTKRYVLVCTDCLSEGINLQHKFSAVVHYDLAWNPTRHEQREGRVDRFGQKRDIVRTYTYYGEDNYVDGIVLKVLLRKHQAIRNQLGVSIPVPTNTHVIEKAILDGLELRDELFSQQLALSFESEEQYVMDVEWNQAAERQKRSRTLFAQRQLMNQMERELRDHIKRSDEAIGGASDVMEFVRNAMMEYNVQIPETDPASVYLGGAPEFVKMSLGGSDTVDVTFSSSFRGSAEHVGRSHALVGALASRIMGESLDSESSESGRRCGVAVSNQVSKRTVLLLLRLRFSVVSRQRQGTEPRVVFAEEIVLCAFEGSPREPRFLPDDKARSLMGIEATANISPIRAKTALTSIVKDFWDMRVDLDAIVESRAQVVAENHKRVREGATSGTRLLRVEAHKPCDVLGIYIFLPSIDGEDQ